MGMLEIVSTSNQNKMEEVAAAAAEATREDRQRTADMTAWPGSQLQRRNHPTWNLTIWSLRHGPDV